MRPSPSPGSPRSPHPEPSDRSGTGKRAAAWAVTLLTTLVLAFVVVFGVMWITTDWSGLACFDGNEPACDELDGEKSGLGAIRASSWIAGAVAVAALAAAYRVTWRLRRGRELLFVVALDGAVVAIAALLWSRL